MTFAPSPASRRAVACPTAPQPMSPTVIPATSRLRYRCCGIRSSITHRPARMSASDATIDEIGTRVHLDRDVLVPRVELELAERTDRLEAGPPERRERQDLHAGRSIDRAVTMLRSGTTPAGPSSGASGALAASALPR